MVQQLVNAMKVVDAMKVIVLPRGNSVGIVVLLWHEVVDTMKMVDTMKIVVLPRRDLDAVGMVVDGVLAVRDTMDADSHVTNHMPCPGKFGRVPGQMGP
jgi:hypothetical protein